jgi:hypothetical protein
MSVVTGVTLISQSCDEDVEGVGLLVQRLNEWIANDPPCGGGKLIRVDEHYGGGKHPENFVWGGGFNYLSWEKFIEYAKILPWRETITLPEEQSVILVISPDQQLAEVHILTQEKR